MTDDHVNPDESDEQGRKVGMWTESVSKGTFAPLSADAIGAIRGYVRQGVGLWRFVAPTLVLASRRMPWPLGWILIGGELATS